MTRTFKQFGIVNILILLLTIFLIGHSSFYLFIYIIQKLNDPKPTFVEPGYQFANFITELRGVKTAGFLTNKKLSREHNDGEFLQAQYLFAPTLLELHQTDHRYIIMDYTDQVFAFYMLDKLKAKPLDHTGFSKILATTDPESL